VRNFGKNWFGGCSIERPRGGSCKLVGLTVEEYCRRCSLINVIGTCDGHIAGRCQDMSSSKV
jgi:hypothetical protein